MRSEASFAALCGACPIEASSGTTVRHRLNRGGDRHANNALWRIATVRLSCDQRSRDYAARRRAEGKTRREIIRCLKPPKPDTIPESLHNPPAVPTAPTCANNATTPRSPSPPPHKHSTPTPDASQHSNAATTTTTPSPPATRTGSPNTPLDTYRNITGHQRAERDPALGALAPPRTMTSSRPSCPIVWRRGDRHLGADRRSPHRAPNPETPNNWRFGFQRGVMLLRRVQLGLPA